MAISWRGLRVGVQEADGHGLDAAPPPRREPRRRHAPRSSGVRDLARGREPLVDLEGPRARHQRHRPLEEEVVRLRPVAAADLVDVARALGDDQRRACAGVLDGDVDRHRRAVHEGFGIARRNARLCETVPHPLRQFVRRGRALRLEHLAAALVERHQIGKGAADIQRNRQHAALLGRGSAGTPRSAASHYSARGRRVAVVANQQRGLPAATYYADAIVVLRRIRQWDATRGRRLRAAQRTHPQRASHRPGRDQTCLEAEERRQADLLAGESGQRADRSATRTVGRRDDCWRDRPSPRPEDSEHYAKRRGTR